MTTTSTYAPKGSQKWLQILINQYPNLIDNEILGGFSASAMTPYPNPRLIGSPLPSEVGAPLPAHVKWLSPLVEDSYKEYKDQKFLERLGVVLTSCPLATFWPDGGPRWDGLGHIEQRAFFLVEAKSHVGEITSSPTGAADDSLEHIKESLQKTKNFLGSSSTAEWWQTYYQYTNRLAHLYLLRELNHLPAYLVNLHFVRDNDVDAKSPDSRGEWEVALKHIKNVLDIQGHKLEPYVIELFFDVVDWRFV